MMAATGQPEGFVSLKRPAWGKLDKESGDYHPLAHHSMDVAAVFLRMLQLPVIGDRLNTAAGAPLPPLTSQRLAMLVFLHDIGKLHPGFQAKGWPTGLWTRPLAGHVDEGCAFFELSFRWPDHPFHATIRKIVTWGEAAEPLLDAVLAHHGKPVADTRDPSLASWRVEPHYDWRREAGVMIDALHRWFGDAFGSQAEPLPCEPQFHHLVAGLVALADWIASDRQFFPLSAPFDLSYDATAHDHARDALAAIGFDPSALPCRPAPCFSQMAGHAAPRPVQAAVAAVAAEARLMVLEAETGSGKTEAAIWRFMQLLAAGAVSGMYFAVPTRAAARQLHGRINAAVRRAYGADAPEAVLAIPGMVRAGDASGRALPDWRVLWEDYPGPAPARWAAEHATRFLAATVAVGTVDQAMLAALQVKHAHLRGSALSRSLLVIDEVHASDAYMTAVIDRLLRGHLATGGYALLMSATLGARARVRWLDEHPVPTLDDAKRAPYPAVWVRGDPRPSGSAGADGVGKRVHTATISTMAPKCTAEYAIAEARRGARVLVIRNTVRVAVSTWEEVHAAGGEALLMRAVGRRAIHHSRFAVEDRRLLDDAVESALSIDPTRTREGCIVIGTQTLEQSLDIDADLLITDLCPMDVLLQRIGRVHRHRLPRPSGFEDARVVVLFPAAGLDPLTAPAFENGLGAWDGPGGQGGIYQDLAVLELTQRMVAAHGVWEIPAMNRVLVEEATHPDRVAAVLAEKGEAWEIYDRKVGGAHAADEQFARMNTLDRSKPFDQLRFPGGDERIMTRLGAEGAVLQLEPAPVGPFGVAVTRITLPPHWSQGITRDHEIRIEREGSELSFTVADKAFRYGRTGLARAS